MKHYGDITKLSGYTLPIVDCIVGGSPCQDLSVAGKRAGLAGERSGLFMEQMRIVKEMRERDVRDGRTAWAVRPRYMVWENVPGAFSSGSPKGSDFAAVIEEIVKVCQPGACVHVPVPDGGWTKSGCYYAEDGSWSIAWRVHDAQFWGVPQRRKRIALVADFGGLSAPEILFERKGLSRDTEPCTETGKAAAGAAGSGVGSASPVAVHLLQDPITAIDSTPCFSAGSSDHGQAMLGVMQSVGCDVYNQEITGDVAASLTAACGGTNTSGAKVLCLNDQGGSVMGVSEDMTGALRAEKHGHQPILFEPRSQDGVPRIHGDVSPTLNTAQGGQRQPCVVDTYQETACALCAGISKQVGNQIVSQDQLITKNAIVRRLTPMEYERLQGYPDGWTDIGEWTDSKGKKHKDADSPRYKALGNSIALPFWQYLARCICAQYERNITMASLFDGIGGFPLVFQRCGATPVWASEIEEFPIAVTKKHFPEEGENKP